MPHARTVEMPYTQHPSIRRDDCHLYSVKYNVGLTAKPSGIHAPGARDVWSPTRLALFAPQCADTCNWRGVREIAGRRTVAFWDRPATETRGVFRDNAHA